MGSVKGYIAAGTPSAVVSLGRCQDITFSQILIRSYVHASTAYGLPADEPDGLTLGGVTAVAGRGSIVPISVSLGLPSVRPNISSRHVHHNPPFAGGPVGLIALLHMCICATGGTSDPYIRGW